MISALDSSVLIAILKGEKTANQWLDLLVKHAALGELVICEIVAAEVSTLFISEKEFENTLSTFYINLKPSSFKSTFLAGEVFLQYRRDGGPRTHLIPDFMIAAHAVELADCLIANDRGYIRRYFKRLKLISID